MKLALIPLLLIGLESCVAAPQVNDAVADGTSCEREADRRAAEAIGETIKPGAATTPGRGS